MESSQFTDNQPHFESLEPINTQGATCDTFRVKLYGKLHFLKRLKSEFANDIRYQEAFRKEFETGYRLEHPNLVRYISQTDDGILMEYIDGETLTQCLANHPDYFEDKKNTDKFLRQLLDVVGYLHSHQVLHLDLKPDNILLTRINNDVKLIDLGCCYTDTFTDTQGRTNRFAAPEQFPSPTGEGQEEVSVDVRSDIFAIGKILELLPNHHIYNKVSQRCTQHDPDSRYQSIVDLRFALFPKKKFMLWPLLMILAVVLIFGYFVFTGNEQPSVEIREPQKGNKNEEIRETVNEEVRETVFVKKMVQPVAKPTSSAPLGPVKSEISKDEEEFINQPHLHIVTPEEFIRYKHLLDEYYSEVNAFLDDTTNYQKYPSHIAYQSQYRTILRRTMERIKADQWFHPLYESPMNPVSSYTREYKSKVEHRASLNGNKLP